MKHKHNRLVGIILLIILFVVFVSYIPQVFAENNNIVDIDN